LKQSVKLHVLNLFDELLQQRRHHHALLDGIISVHDFKRSGDNLLDPPTRPLGRVIGSAKCPARCGGPSHSARRNAIVWRFLPLLLSYFFHKGPRLNFITKATKSQSSRV
jgi:hypothetical protein